VQRFQHPHRFGAENLTQHPVRFGVPALHCLQRVGPAIGVVQAQHVVDIQEYDR